MTDNTQSDVVEFASARRVYQDGGNWAEILTALRSDRDAVVEEERAAAYERGWIDCKETMQECADADARNEGLAQYQSDCRSQT